MVTKDFQNLAGNELGILKILCTSLRFLFERNCVLEQYLTSQRTKTLTSKCRCGGSEVHFFIFFFIYNSYFSYCIPITLYNKYGYITFMITWLCGIMAYYASKVSEYFVYIVILPWNHVCYVQWTYSQLWLRGLSCCINKRNSFKIVCFKMLKLIFK